MERFRMPFKSFDDLLNNTSFKADESMPPYVHVFNSYFQTIISEIQMVKELTVRLNAVEEENKKLRCEIDQLKVRADDAEQRSRNSCLLVHGIQESDDENTDDLVMDVIKNKLNIELEDDKIIRTHRIGEKKAQMNTRATPSRPRPIIFKFSHFKERQKVYMAKKALKGTKIVITENLTKLRYDLYQAAKTKYGMKNCWTNEGRLHAKVNNRTLTIEKMSDII